MSTATEPVLAGPEDEQCPYEYPLEDGAMYCQAIAGHDGGHVPPAPPEVLGFTPDPELWRIPTPPTEPDNGDTEPGPQDGPAEPTPEDDTEPPAEDDPGVPVDDEPTPVEEGPEAPQEGDPGPTP